MIISLIGNAFVCGYIVNYVELAQPENTMLIYILIQKS